MSTDPRWTPETEEAVARVEHALDEQMFTTQDTWEDVDPPERELYLRRARVALAAIADLGVLREPGRLESADGEPSEEDVIAHSVHPLWRVWAAGADATNSPDFRDASGKLDEEVYIRYGLNVMREVHATVEQAARRDGWQRAVACLEGVVKRTGSPSAKYWADYLTIDPDKEFDREVPNAG